MDNALIVQDEYLQKTIDVLQLKFADPTRTIIELCEEVGITRKTYYQKLSDGKELIQTMRGLINRSKRIQLATIAMSKHTIIENMVDQAIETSDLDVMVKVSKYLDEHAENLQDDLGAKPGLEDEARDFLKHGPKLAKQESKFASIRVSEDEDGEPVIDIYKQVDIIDGHVEDV